MILFLFSKFLNANQDDETPIDFTQISEEGHTQGPRVSNTLNPINYGDLHKKPLPQMTFPKSDSEKADSPYNFGEQENEGFGRNPSYENL